MALTLTALASEAAARGALTALRAWTSLSPSAKGGKTGRFVRNQSGLAARVGAFASGVRREGVPVVWFHASSLGEYQIARPVIRRIREGMDCTVVLTFFSPTGIAALEGKTPEATGADAVLPLPVDTRANARRFLNAVRPDAAVFLVSEYWPNFLNALKRRGVPTVLMSASFSKAPGGLTGAFKSAMARMFDTVIVHDTASEANLRALGCATVVRTGDPLFDNALAVRGEPFDDPVLNRFTEGADRVFVGGSLHADADLALMTALSAANPGMKFIMVPHETDSATIEAVRAACPGKSAVYSAVASGSETADDADWLIVDFVGALARIYRYGTAAYVGGGFTRLLHSVVEPAVYGLPLCFGPRTERKSIARRMIAEGFASAVSTPGQIADWWSRLVTTPGALHAARNAAQAFYAAQAGGAAAAAKIITDKTNHEITQQK